MSVSIEPTVKLANSKAFLSSFFHSTSTPSHLAVALLKPLSIWRFITLLFCLLLSFLLPGIHTNCKSTLFKLSTKHKAWTAVLHTNISDMGTIIIDHREIKKWSPNWQRTAASRWVRRRSPLSSLRDHSRSKRTETLKKKEFSVDQIYIFGWSKLFYKWSVKHTPNTIPHAYFLVQNMRR